MIRPAGSVDKWSRSQLSKWIKSSVESGMHEFSAHAELERGPQRNISNIDALDAIAKGKVVNVEPGTTPVSGRPSIKVTFKAQLRARRISVVTAANDGSDFVHIITAWQDKS